MFQIENQSSTSISLTKVPLKAFIEKNISKGLTSVEIASYYNTISGLKILLQFEQQPLHSICYDFQLWMKPNR